MNTEEIKVSEEEKAEETEAQAEVKEDEVRAKVVSDLGIEDTDENAELIGKLVSREVGQRQKLSQAVGQKIKYREMAQGGKKPEEPAKKTEEKSNAEDPVEAAKKATREEFMQRDLDDMSHSDEIKAEIKDIAERKNISIRKAEQDGYVQHLIAEEAKAKSVDDAAKNGGKKSNSGAVVDVSKPLNPADFDMSTPEGRAEWADAKKARQNAKE